MGSEFWSGSAGVEGARSTLAFSQEALRNHVFFVDGKQVLLRKGGQGLISLLLGASFTMIIVGGIVLSSFTFRIDGLAGFAVDFARTDQAAEVQFIQGDAKEDSSDHEEEPEGGIIVKWSAEKGFGFVKPDKGGENLFFHF